MRARVVRAEGQVITTVASAIEPAA